MGTVTGGQLAAEALVAQGLEVVFSLSGGHITPIYNYLEDSPVRILDTRHEQAAVFMAEAWGRLTRTPGCALVTAGPGFTNALTGIANAKQANSPLVVISGAVAVGFAEKLDLQDMTQAPVAEPMVKKALVCHTASRIPEFVDLAFRTAASGRPGPVYLELPVDMLNAEIDEDKVWRTQSGPAVSHPADPAGATQLLDLLKAASAPAIVAGNGAWYADCGAELKAFAEQTGAPVFTIGLGRGLLPDTHELCFESAMAIRPGASMHAQSNADLVVLLGTRISLHSMFGRIYSPDVKLVQVDAEPEELGRNRSVDLPIFSDVKGLLAECNRQLAADGATAELPGRFADWRAELAKEHAANQEQAVAAWEGDGPPIPPKRLAREVDDFLDREDDIVVADGGDTQIWMGMTRTVRQAGRYLDSGLYGCLGVGLPFALAAKLKNPDSRVCLIIGDGSTGFNFMEFQTALHKQLPIVVVISNDLGWGMIRHSQTLKLGRSIPEGTELGNVPYHQMVEALGGKGILVERVEDIRPALEEAFAAGVVTCINVMTDPTTISPGSVALASVGAYGG